jgi:hypothetical protein
MHLTALSCCYAEDEEIAPASAAEDVDAAIAELPGQTTIEQRINSF